MTHANDALFDTSATESISAVECLGIAFPNDEARRAYFLDKLREKLQDPAFRQLQGFPLGSDEDILALSDPPYYTACPNPFIEDFIADYGTPYDPNVPYTKESFATDVSEGRTDPLYLTHSYPTKVPHKAIMRYILHYTEPGNIIFDGFSGTGMTAVAAQLCGNRKAVEELGYRVLDDGTILNDNGQPFSRLGVRQTVLNDLSPSATFIASNYNLPVDVTAFETAAKGLLERFEEKYGWMYKTRHSNEQYGRINFVVWSDVFLCNYCQSDIVFWTEAVDDGDVKADITCPHCRARVSKNTLDRATTTVFDNTLEQAVSKAKRIPILIKYSIGVNRFEKVPEPTST